MTLCVAPDEFLAKNPQRIVDTMGVTHLHLTPTLASRLDPQSMPSLKYLGTSGEPLTAKVHRDWAGKNLYHGISNLRHLSGRYTSTDTLWSSLYHSRDCWSLYSAGEGRDVQRNHQHWYAA